MHEEENRAAVPGPPDLSGIGRRPGELAINLVHLAPNDMHSNWQDCQSFIAFVVLLC